MKPPRAFNYKDYNYERGTFFLKDHLSFSNAGHFIEKLNRFIPSIKEKHITIDLTSLEKTDSAGVSAIYYLLEQLNKYNIATEITGANSSVSEKLELFKPPKTDTSKKSREENFYFKTGDRVWHFFTVYGKEYFYLMADIFYWSIVDLFKTGQRRKGEFINQAVSIGVNAVPIVFVLTFIIGLVISVHSAVQLKSYGANIYIVDMIVLSIMAEMGPLITAILVAGRSGSAIAAEIATMKVTSETDALTTMGLNPLRFVVIPKIYGGIITLPLLTMMANVAGIAGGALAAYFYLDITPETFISRMSGVLYQKDIITGIIKSIVFIIIIVVTGSFFGMHVKQGAEGVGISTTQSVVASIALVIVADLIMGLIFY